MKVFLVILGVVLCAFGLVAGLLMKNVDLSNYGHNNEVVQKAEEKLEKKHNQDTAPSVVKSSEESSVPNLEMDQEQENNELEKSGGSEPTETTDNEMQQKIPAKRKKIDVESIQVDCDSVNPEDLLNGIRLQEPKTPIKENNIVVPQPRKPKVIIPPQPQQEYGLGLPQELSPEEKERRDTINREKSLEKQRRKIYHPPKKKKTIHTGGKPRIYDENGKEKRNTGEIKYLK